MDLSAIAGRDASTPLVQILPPFKKDGAWYGALVVNVNGEPVRLVASASEELLKKAYEMASQYVTYGNVGVANKPPPGSLRAKLIELSPYLPSEGLTLPQRKAVEVLKRAASGCESCIDAIRTVDEKAKAGDEKHRKLRKTFNEVIGQAKERRALIQKVAAMSPSEFYSFFQKVTRL